MSSRPLGVGILGPHPAWSDSRGWVSWNAAASSDRLHWGDASESDNGRGSHDDRSIGSYQAQLDPDVELQWSQITGMKLLENIDMDNCPRYPEDMDDEPWLIENCMMSMHMALKRCRPDDVIMDLDKKHTVNSANLWSGPPPWMTLKPPPDLKVWVPILKEQEIDNDALGSLVHVITHAHDGNHGYYEGIRIIAHLLKDTAHPEWRKGPSAWLHGACSESMTAMLNWADWDCEHNSRSSRASTSMPTHWNDYKPITRRGLR